MKCLLVAALMLSGAQAFAQSIVPKLDQEGRKGDIGRMQAEKAMKRFDELDADKDGRLSREEVKDVGYLNESYEKHDKNKDGFLSWEEYVGHNRWPKEARKD